MPTWSCLQSFLPTPLRLFNGTQRMLLEILYSESPLASYFIENKAQTPSYELTSSPIIFTHSAAATLTFLKFCHQNLILLYKL